MVKANSSAFGSNGETQSPRSFGIENHVLISMPLQSAKLFVAKFALKNVIPYPNNGYSFDIGQAFLHASFHLTP
jgi:hypothetical protein